MLPPCGYIVDNLIKSEKTRRYAYTKLLEHLKYNTNLQEKWTDNLHINLNDSDWQKIFMLIRGTTLDANLRVFQYKILHRVLPTNKLLHIYRIKPSPECDTKLLRL